MQVQVTGKREFLPQKSKTKSPRKSSVLSEVFHEYCSNASLHGVGYMGDKDKTYFEKIWWFVVFMLSLSICAYLISRTWIKWENSPVIVSFAQEQTPIWEIPFPAVTICPLSKVKQNVYNYTDYFQRRNNLTGDERKFFWDVSLVCNLEYFDFPEFDADNTTNEDAIQNIIDVAPNNIIRLVYWQYEYVKENLIFKPQLTEEGICFTSNSLSQKDMFTDKLNHNVPFITLNDTNDGWDIENGYPPGLDLHVYPRRTAQDGYVAGLSVTLKHFLNETDYLCGIPVSGYKLILHNPAELPRVGQKYIIIPLNQQVTISVYPLLLTTSTGLLSISPKTRNCYFAREKSLLFFNIYTQNNCKMECLANITKAVCGCIPFFLPRDNNTLICGYGKVICITKIRELIQHYEMLQKENMDKLTEKQRFEYQIYKDCNCLPSCSSLQYNAETSQAETHFVETILVTGKSTFLNDEELDSIVNGEVAITQLDIFFKENHFIAMHRSELYGQTDFLANCGGLLGLFLGFSILSIVEIVYFVTIRIYYKIKQNKKEKVNVMNNLVNSVYD